MRTQAVIRFQDFELDAERYELRRAGQVQKLERIPMELLLMLASRPGLLVTRAEIAEALWDTGVHVDAERGINTAVAKIRRVLADDAGRPQCVQTVVAKGYRFVADILPEEAEEPVEQTGDDLLSDRSPLASLVDTDQLSNGSPVREARHLTARVAYLFFGLSLILLAGVVILLSMRGIHPLLWPWFRTDIRSVAVLPLANLANDPAQEYFVDGMTDQLITNLAQATSLRVISRTSVMQFKNARKPLPEIARLLNVDAVVEGSVMRVAGQLSIQAQLLDARSDRHLWAQTYRGNSDQALLLGNEVTRDVAQHVAATLRPHARIAMRMARKLDGKAFEDYLRGRFYLAKRTPDALQKALVAFQNVISHDPGYAPAYVGLADTYNVISFYGGAPPSESFPHAESAARKALLLEPDLGEAHAALGETLFSYYWDWSGAEREFREAIRLTPESALAHHWYSELLSMLGRHSEALAEIRRARDLDPLSLVINATLAGTLYLARDYHGAIAAIRKTLELDAAYGPAHQTLVWIYIYTNQGGKAIEEAKKAISLSGDSAALRSILACAYAAAGDVQQAKRSAVKLEALSKREYVSPESLARLYVLLSDSDAALDKLEKAFERHVDTLNNIYVEPVYDRLRSNPRFVALLRKLRFLN